jgi:hypothetical protein
MRNNKEYYHDLILNIVSSVFLSGDDDRDVLGVSGVTLQRGFKLGTFLDKKSNLYFEKCCETKPAFSDFLIIRFDEI